MSFDGQIVSAVQQVTASSPLWIAFSVFLAKWLIFVFVLFGIYLATDKKGAKRHAVLEAAWSAALALLITSILAAFIQRLRPFQATLDLAFPITLLIRAPFNMSFPSGHTGTAVAMAAALFFADRRVGIVAFVAVALIAFGRIAVGVHYPTDILGGIVVGFISFGIVRAVHRALRTRDLYRAAKHHHHA